MPAMAKADAEAGFIAARPGAIRFRDSRSNIHPVSTLPPTMTAVRAVAKAALPELVLVLTMKIFS